jgi:uncharacterized protein (TIGR04222 family)
VSRQGNTITWTAKGTIDSGGFEVGAEIPRGLLSALKPSWQDSVDQTEGQAPPLQQPEQPGITYTNPAQAWIDLGILLFSVLLIAVGVLWRVVSWYRTGRDKPVVLPADYLAEPPSDLPPGLAGALIDEHADLRDVMSTLVDQARKGALTMAEVQNGAIRDFEYTRIQKKDTMRYPYERMVMSAVFGGRSTAYLSQARGRLEKKLPAIYESMYKSLVHMGYFPESPEQVRNRSGAGCGLLVTLGMVAVLAGLLFGQYLSYMLVFLGMAIVVVALVRVFTKSAMPRKTDKGAEEAERWRAFKRYLQQIQTYTNVQEAADRFQKYLPYAVAMGVDREFINQFNSVPTAIPEWFTPYGYVPSILDYVPSGASSSPGTGGGISTVPISPPVSTGAPGVPIAPFDPGGAAQGMSDSFGDAMQGMSNSFTNMVNTASGVFGGAPSGGGGKNSGIGDGGGSSGAGAQIASDIASSVGGLLIGAAISVVFGGGGGGGGGGGAD